MNKPAEKALQATPAAQNPSLMARFAEQYGIEAGKMMNILRSTAFNTGKKDGKPNPPATDEEIAALVVIANVYHLNPFLKEIYAFRNKGGGISPIVGFDGWIRLVQAQPQFDGEELVKGYDEELHTDGKPLGSYYECTMHRKDRKHPSKLREYLRENWRPTEPWEMMPNRMLRMRSYIQCARICFGFGGIYDPFEGEVVRDAIDVTPSMSVNTKPVTRAPREKLTHQPAQTLETKLREQTADEFAEGARPLADADEPLERVSLASEPDYHEEEEAGARG